MVKMLEQSRVLVAAANRRVEVDRVDRAIDIMGDWLSLIQVSLKGGRYMWLELYDLGV